MTRHENPLHRRVVVLVTLVSFMAACHKWVPLESPVEQTLAEHHGKVRLTLEDNQRIEFDSVWVSRDSVFSVASGDTVAIASLSYVVGADERKANTTGTIVLVGLGAVVVGLGIYFAACASAVDENTHKC